MNLALLLLVSCASDSKGPTAPVVNQPPRVSGVTFTPATVLIGQQARIRVDATDPDQDALTAVYVSQLGSVAPDANSLNATYTPLRTGQDYIVVKVIDARGAETRWDAYVTVTGPPGTGPGTTPGEGPPPRIVLQPPPVGYTVVVGQGDSVRVDLCGESAAAYRISWGDGAADATTCSAEHAYDTSGTFRLVVHGSGASLSGVQAKANFRAEFFVSVIPPLT